MITIQKEISIKKNINKRTFIFTIIHVRNININININVQIKSKLQSKQNKDYDLIQNPKFVDNWAKIKYNKH